VRSFDFCDLYDKRRATPIQWYEDYRSAKYGKPRVYLLTSLRGGVSEVHESRLMMMPGLFTLDQERYENDWWDYSVFQTTHESIKQFNEASKAIELLMVEASQFIYKVSGLINAMAGGQQKTIEQRMALLDMSRSVARAIMLDPDKGEDATRLATQFAGIGDAWDRISIRLCAAAEVPVTIMLGRSPAGENSTGDADFRAWYDRLKSYQRRTLLPRVKRLVFLARRALGIERPVGVRFPSLWQESPAEFADRRLKTSQADALDVANSILDPEEIAESRYGGEEYSSETKLNRAKGFGVPGSIVAPRGAGKVGAAPATSAPPMPPRLPPTGSGAPVGAPKLPPPSVAWQGKPGGGRLARSVPATTGNAWPAGTTRPGDEGLTR
jgi:phage-related protein (TIGR01555 family)